MEGTPKQVIRLGLVLLAAAAVACSLGTEGTESAPLPSTDCPSAVLQVGNTASCPPLITRQSKELADNRVGALAETRHIGDWVWTTGLKWMQTMVDPSGRWQHVDWATDGYAIAPPEERVIDDLVRHSVKIMLKLDVWDDQDRTVFHKSEEDIRIYLSWVRHVVRHFRGRVQYYEILNEPHLNFEAPAGMPVDAYVNLVKRAVPVIRGEDPQAKIVVGSVPDTRFDNTREWMWGVLTSEIMSLVDGFSWHPMFGPAPSDDPRGVRQPDTPQMESYWENYPALVQEIMRLAAANGFRGEYMVGAMIWRTPSEPHETEPYGFTDMSGAKYYARAIVIHLGLDVTTGLGVIIQGSRHRVVQALSTVLAGARPADVPVVVQSTATKVRHYGFALPNGDRLLAIWTDGAAVEADPGVRATLLFSDPSLRRAVGVDPLRGLEQELLVGSAGGNLVLQDLLLRDYPILVRLGNQ